MCTTIRFFCSYSNRSFFILNHHFRFKNTDDLRVHCKDHDELKCEICSEVFCNGSDLVAHQEQGCEALIESPDLVEIKPTFIDCHLESDANLEQQDVPFAIIPKVIYDSSNDASLYDIDRNGDETIDDSYRAENSAENIPIHGEPSHSKVTNKTRTRPSQKRNARKSKKHQNENDDAADRIFHCYLCEKK